MKQLAIDLKFSDRDTATQVTRLLAKPSDRAPAPVRLEVQESPADSLQATDWSILPLLLAFGGGIAMGAASKIGELLVEQIAELAHTIRSSSRDKAPALPASEERHQSMTRTSKTSVTIAFEDHSKSIQVTAETTDAEIITFAESVRRDYES
jgi:hypothetical protein